MFFLYYIILNFSFFNPLTADFNPKASKKSLIETLLYALREAIDNHAAGIDYNILDTDGTRFQFDVTLRHARNDFG